MKIAGGSNCLKGFGVRARERQAKEASSGR